MHSVLRVLPAVALLATNSLLAQTTVTVPCLQDNTLYEDPAGGLSNGAGTAMFIGFTGQPTNPLRRGLVKFDVAAFVPPGAHIVAAQLQITTVQSSFAGPVDIFGHRLTQPWGEGASVAPGGGGGGGAAALGDATWIHTFSPLSFWTNAGGDFAANPSLVITTQPLGTAVSAASAALRADVQSMLDNPLGNHGWLLKTSEALAFVTRKVDSRETTTGTPPSLTVRYLLPTQTGTHGTGCTVGANTFDYAFTGPATGGAVVNLVQTNGPANQLAINLLSLGFDPAGIALLPACPLYLPLGPFLISHSVVVLDPFGGASAALTLPIGFPGLVIYAQSAALANTPAGFVVSNAAIAFLL